VIQSDFVMESERNLNGLLIAAAIVAAPRLASIELKRTPAFLSIVADSIWAAEFIMRVLRGRHPAAKQASVSTETNLRR